MANRDTDGRYGVTDSVTASDKQDTFWQLSGNQLLSDGLIETGYGSLCRKKGEYYYG